MKNIRDFLSENFLFLEVKISTYLNRHVFIMFIHDRNWDFIFRWKLANAQTGQLYLCLPTSYFRFPHGAWGTNDMIGVLRL